MEYATIKFVAKFYPNNNIYIYIYSIKVYNRKNVSHLHIFIKKITHITQSCVNIYCC